MWQISLVVCRLCRIDYKELEEKIYDLPEPRTIEGYDAIVDNIDPLPEQAEVVTIENLHEHVHYLKYPANTTIYSCYLLILWDSEFGNAKYLIALCCFLSVHKKHEHKSRLTIAEAIPIQFLLIEVSHA